MVECFSLSVSLSLFLSVSLFRHLSTELPFKPSTYLPVYSCIYRSICLFTYLLNCLSFCLSSHSSIHLLLSVSFFFRPSLHPSMSTAIHHHVLRSVSLSIHPCISSSYPSIYLATHAFIWSSTLLAIFRSSDLCVHLSIHLPVY